MVPATSHMFQEIISLQQPYMGKRNRLAAECCVHNFFLGVEGVDVSIRSHQLRFSLFMNTDPYHH